MNDQFKEQKGFLTFAQNNSTTDYLRLAYCQALSIKATQSKVTSVAVAVDEPTKAMLTDAHRAVFDYIVDIPNDAAANDDWKLKNEWKAFFITPFKETIKIESDILLVNNIDHWWPALQQREVCLTEGIVDYRGEQSPCRAYRKLFDDNNLPDLYSGLMYFRYSRFAMEFFETAGMIYEDWPYYRDQLLIKCVDDQPTTDVVYAIAALILGIEQVTNRSSTIPTFAHMKGAVNGLGVNSDWTQHFYAQTDDNLNITINHSRQLYPLHYQVKGYITDEILQKYERAYERRKSSAN